MKDITFCISNTWKFRIWDIYSKGDEFLGFLTIYHFIFPSLIFHIFENRTSLVPFIYDSTQILPILPWVRALVNIIPIPKNVPGLVISRESSIQFIKEASTYWSYWSHIQFIKEDSTYWSYWSHILGLNGDSALTSFPMTWVEWHTSFSCSKSICEGLQLLTSTNKTTFIWLQ